MPSDSCSFCRDILYYADPFFVCLGIYQSFQNAREANDLVFSSLLPISKDDIVKGKIIFVILIEICGILVMFIVVIIRMTILSESQVYLHNALMNGNMFALGVAFVIFGAFNMIFVTGFFKTVYRLGMPFVSFMVAAFVIIGGAECMHHIPGLGAVNSFGFENMELQILLLFAGILIYGAMTCIAWKQSCRYFDKIDL